MSSLKVIRKFVDSVDGIDTSILEAVSKLDFVNKQLKNQKLIKIFFIL